MGKALRSVYKPTHLQAQYEFIHCGLSELVVCGETEVAAANLRITLKNLKKKGGDGLTGFQRQMQVHVSRIITHSGQTQLCIYDLALPYR